MGVAQESSRKVPALGRGLLGWYKRNKRDLPWRKNRDAYAIWVSEIMLQQTRVAAVMERYNGFLARFPTVVALAEAEQQEVLALWSGLGYYRRARMLHKAARVVVEAYAGTMPKTAEALRELPGIGAYTAAAIASIAHEEPVAVVDGNVERVICRLRGWATDGSTVLRRKVQAHAALLLDPKHPGDFNQAMMELGAMLCTPRNPQCLLCPLHADCKTRGEHKTAQRARLLNQVIGVALCVRKGVGSEKVEVLLEQRPEAETVMPGMWQLPALIDFGFDESELRMNVKHAIMQVNYTVRVRDVKPRDVKDLTAQGGKRKWIAPQQAKAMALTGLARKILGRAGLI